MLGQYGDMMCENLGLAWAEAILTQELSEEERRTWEEAHARRAERLRKKSSPEPRAPSPD